MCLYFVQVVTHSQLEHEGLQSEDQLEVLDVIQDSENSTFLKCPIGLRDSKEGEQARRLHQKSDFVKVLDSMRIPLGRFYVPFCRMIPLPKVRPI